MTKKSTEKLASQTKTEAPAEEIIEAEVIEANAMVAEEEKPMVPEAAPATSIIQVIERAATDPNVDIDKMERLLAMKERLDAKDAEKHFNEAMNECQKQMRRIGANATNPQTQSRYATYDALDKALRPIYTSHGFSISFDTDESPLPEHIRVLAYVSHGAGHTRTYRADIASDGKGPKGNAVMSKTHATGSAMSYGMRYLLKMIFNVAIGEDDDDGNAAGQNVQYITEEQVNILHSKITENGIEMDKFMNWLKRDLKCDALEGITVQAYATVEARINSAIRAKKKTQNKGEIKND